MENLVERVRRGFLEDGLALALFPLGIDDLVAFLPFFQHVANERWRVLQVSVDDDDGLSPGMPESRAECRLVPEVPAEAYQPVLRRRGQEAFQDFARPVRGTIVDENQLVLDVGKFLFEDGERLCDDFFFIVERDDDG